MNKRVLCKHYRDDYQGVSRWIVTLPAWFSNEKPNGNNDFFVQDSLQLRLTLSRWGIKVNRGILIGGDDMASSGWEYDISVLSWENIIGRTTGDNHARIFFCEDEGPCSEDKSDNKKLDKIISVLNSKGLQNWELVQAVLQDQGLICFWKRPK